MTQCGSGTCITVAVGNDRDSVIIRSDFCKIRELPDGPTYPLYATKEEFIQHVKDMFDGKYTDLFPGEMPDPKDYIRERYITLVETTLAHAEHLTRERNTIEAAAKELVRERNELAAQNIVLINENQELSVLIESLALPDVT